MIMKNLCRNSEDIQMYGFEGYLGGFGCCKPDMASFRVDRLDFYSSSMVHEWACLETDILQLYYSEIVPDLDRRRAEEVVLLRILGQDLNRLGILLRAN